jgi:hypothetical protein
VHRWTRWTSGGHHSATDGPLLPLLRCGIPLDLAVHHLGQCVVHAIQGSGEYRCAVQGLRCAVPIHIQRTQELKGPKEGGL